MTNRDEKQSKKWPETFATRDWTLGRVTMMLELYRGNDQYTSESFITGMVKVLLQWPPQVIWEVTEPTGLPAKHKFIPALAEVQEACTAAYAPIERERRRNIKQLPAPALDKGTIEERAEQIRRHGINLDKAPDPAVIASKREEARLILQRYAAEKEAADAKAAAAKQEQKEEKLNGDDGA